MIEELKKNIELLKIKHKKISNKIDKYLLENQYMPYPENLEKISVDILNSIEQYKFKLFALENSPGLSNDEIDLYLWSDNDSYSEHIIFLHETNTYIGQIMYQKNLPQSHKEFAGNISFMILSEYRGNNYALSALNLLTDKLYENNINEVFIAAEKNNIPSIKTIERFGGSIINSSSIVSYRCDLNAIKGILNICGIKK